VTLVAMTVTKTLGALRVVWLMHAGVRDALPWRRLAEITAIALLSVVPMLWLQETVTWHPMVTFLTGASLYAATYALLSYGGSQVLGCLSAPVPVAPEHLRT
jgi:hypothetical protein